MSLLTDDEIRALLDGATPGPWRSSETWRPPIGFGDHETNSDGNVFWGYSVSGSNKHGGHILPTLAAVHNFPDNIHANARLIAAAPDAFAEVLRLREALRDTTASLVAAVSLLERGGKKAAPSDKMFAVMLDDYRASIDRARAALKGAAE